MMEPGKEKPPKKVTFAEYMDIFEIPGREEQQSPPAKSPAKPQPEASSKKAGESDTDSDDDAPEPKADMLSAADAPPEPITVVPPEEMLSAEDAAFLARVTPVVRPAHHVASGDNIFADEREEEQASMVGPVAMGSKAYLLAVCGAAYLLYKYRPTGEFVTAGVSKLMQLSAVTSEYMRKPFSSRPGK